jgi:fermentation-respiration switch protein FrsA (DUF1100 family)
VLTTPLLNGLLYFPSRAAVHAPAGAADMTFETDDGERLHAWWVPARVRSLGHVLLCHGNAGNIGDRRPYVDLLATAGFDVLAFDYRGYGRSSGRPSENGLYRDARAARAALLGRPEVDAARVIYLGESLGGSVALALALEQRPAGLILQSAFTSVRDMARVHYPFIPPVLVPDAFPSLRLIGGLRAPLLVLHGERDEIVPLIYGEALADAAPEPKRIHIFRAAGHNDLLARAASEWTQAIVEWARELRPGE